MRRPAASSVAEYMLIATPPSFGWMSAGRQAYAEGGGFPVAA